MRHRADQSRRPFLSIALGAALLLRVLVPAGYMPASLADGWLLQLCPDGLPAAAVQALLGPTHHHHHHLDDAAPGSNGAAMPEQCDLGAGFAMALSVAPASLGVPALVAATLPRRDVTGTPGLAFRPSFLPRAPPALIG